MRRSLSYPLVAACGATVLALGGLGAGPAHATTPPVDAAAAAAPVVTSASTITLPLLGVPLTVDLTTGPGGALSSVIVNPADGMTATTLKPNKVVFVNDAGTAKVIVKTGHGTQSVEAKASSLDDFVAGGGFGQWTGDVFGTGTTTTVSYSIAKLADGSPDITGINSADPTVQFGEVIRETGDDGEQQAKIRVTFTNGTQSRTLTIKVEVDTGDDGTSRAKVKVSLSPVKGLALPAAQVAGAQVWNGVLCNGAAARIDYTITTEGDITGASATPPTTRLDVNGNHLDARWAEGGRVKIKVRGNDGQLQVSVEDRTRCDSPPPSVNTDISTSTSVEDGEDKGGDSKHRGGGRGGKDHGATTTTAAGNTDATTTSDSGSKSGSGGSDRKRGGDNGDD